MKWFRTLWLTSEERQLLKELKQERDKRNSDISPTQVAAPKQESPTLVGLSSFSRSYKNILYNDGYITVIFNNGDVVCKTGVDINLFNKVKDATSQKEIEDLLVDKSYITEEIDNKDETEERSLVNSNLDIFKGNTDFEVQGHNVILSGVNLAIPYPVLASFIEILEKSEAAEEDTTLWSELQKQYCALKMFWLKLSLNTLPQSREDLLIFIKKNNVKITNNGNLILYRRIMSKAGTDKELVTFVTQNYYNIKKSGLDPREFAVCKNNGYSLFDLKNHYTDEVKANLVGNLQVMYLELPTYDSNEFTAYYDKTVSIKLGGIYSIPDSKINLDNGICAAGGLHAAAVDYNYSGFGDIPVVVLVNPSKAITVPLGETGKLRTVEMFVACVNDKPQGVHFDENTLSSFDEEYHDYTLEELEHAAQSKCFDSLSVQDNVPAISLVDLNQITEMLRGRVHSI